MITNTLSYEVLTKKNYFMCSKMAV